MLCSGSATVDLTIDIQNEKNSLFLFFFAAYSNLDLRYRQSWRRILFQNHQAAIGRLFRVC